MNEGAPPKTGWLFGAGSDLVLGCGLGSMAVMLAQVAVGPSLPRLIPGALLILLFALPHYGATLIRAYEDPADRSRYRVFSLWATLVVGSCFLGSLYLWVRREQGFSLSPSSAARILRNPDPSTTKRQEYVSPSEVLTLAPP